MKMSTFDRPRPWEAPPARAAIPRANEWPQLDYGTLDPGIRKTVRVMRDALFNTCDSGDGVSKPPDERVVEGPHVFCRCVPRLLVDEADRMQREIVGDREGVTVEASYSPADGVGIIAVFGLSDEGL